MRITADEIGVDAGIIMVADMNYLKSCPSPNKSELKRLGKVFKVPKGHYKIHWYLPSGEGNFNKNDYIDGDNIDDDNICEGDNELTVTSGKIFVCDPCYVIGTAKHEDWLEWLEATDYGEKLNDPRAFTIHSMGGDGVYKVIMELEMVK